MKQQLRKAFTIVELVIVIAVIAILAAVLIPTFVNVTKNAKISADKQTVYEMNAALAVDEIENGVQTDVFDMIAHMQSEGYNFSASPFASGYGYFWNKEINRIVLIDDSGSAPEIVYPEEYIAEIAADDYVRDGGELLAKSSATYFLLNMDMSECAAKLEGSNLYSATLSEAVSAAQKSGSPVVLLSDVTSTSAIVTSADVTIDLNGHTVNFDVEQYGFAVIGGTTTIVGGDSEASGLGASSTGKVVFESKTATAKEYQMAFYVCNPASLELKNLTVESSRVYSGTSGEFMAGIYLVTTTGSTTAPSVKLENVDIQTTVNANSSAVNQGVAYGFYISGQTTSSGGSVEIHNSNLNINSSFQASGIRAWGNGDNSVTVTDSKITVNSGSAIGSGIQICESTGTSYTSRGDLTVKNTQILLTTGNVGYGIYVGRTQAGDVEIDGCTVTIVTTFSGDCESVGIWYQTNADEYAKSLTVTNTMIAGNPYYGILYSFGEFTESGNTVTGATESVVNKHISYIIP